MQLGAEAKAQVRALGYTNGGGGGAGQNGSERRGK
jgi:hypothetical protein